MPRYDFECLECHHEFELSLSLAEREENSEKKVCPKCESQKVEQLMTFKGGIKTKGASGNFQVPPCASGGGCPSGGCPFGG